MFDTYHIPPRPVSHTTYNKTEVNEHRAPTDESIKLLREMEAKALSNIVNSVRVENTLFSCVIHSMIEPLYMHNKFAIILKINGKQIDIRVEIDSNKTEQQTAEIIFKSISDRIASEAIFNLHDAFQNLSFGHQFT